MLDYLSYLFDLDYEYRKVGCHRSAISAYHEYADNKSVGQHPHVCALLKRVLNEGRHEGRPQPRCLYLGHSNCFRFYKMSMVRV